MAGSGRGGIAYLVACCVLAFYAFFTAMYHMADLAAGFDPDGSNPVASVALKFRASIECRDYVAQTGDESCYSKWHV